MKLLFTVLVVVCLAGCSEMEPPAERAFIVGYAITDNDGYKIVSSIFSVGSMQPMGYFQKSIADAYTCEGWRIDSGMVKILSISELGGDDFKLFKGMTEWPPLCKPDSLVRVAWADASKATRDTMTITQKTKIQ